MLHAKPTNGRWKIRNTIRTSNDRTTSGSYAPGDEQDGKDDMKPQKRYAAILIAVLAAGTAGAENAMPQLIVFDEGQMSLGATASAQSTTPAGDNALAQLRRDPGVSELEVGWSAAQAAIRNKGFTLSSGNARQLAHIEGLEVTSTKGTTHLYRYDIETGNETSITVRENDMLGRVRVGPDTWRITPLGDGRTAVFRYETSTIRRHPQGWDELVGKEPQRPGEVHALGKVTEKHQRRTGETKASETIDVLVAYTSAARTAAQAGGASIDLALAAIVADTNRMFKRSRINTRIELVHTVHVSYTQGANMKEDLCRLTGRGRTWGGWLRTCATTGVTRPEALDGLHKMRDKYKADLVTLMVGMKANRRAGIAWIAPEPDYAFSVFSAEAELAGQYVFAHEIGHNMGAGHNPGRATRGNGQPLRPYGHGRCNTKERWHTVMSYSDAGPPTFKRCSQSRVAAFSSPRVAGPKGTPLGDEHTHNVARLISETTGTVSKHRGYAFTHLVPFMPGTRMQEQGLVGSVRIGNGSRRGGRIQIKATDDSGKVERTSIWIGALKARQFTSRDLEAGNRKGLREGIGPGTGHRRLVLESDLSLAVRGHVLTHDGLVISADETAQTFDIDPGELAGIHFLNPGSAGAASVLRIINPHGRRVDIKVLGIDDQGVWGEESVTFELGAKRAINIASRTLEEGPSFATGALGDGAGKWRLLVSTSERVHIMSLLFSQTGYVSNLSR